MWFLVYHCVLEAGQEVGNLPFSVLVSRPQVTTSSLIQVLGAGGHGT